MTGTTLPAKGIRWGPIRGTPLLRVGSRDPTLVAADIHIGLSWTSPRGANPPQGDPLELAERLLHGLAESRGSALLIVGDVKDPIAPTPWFVRRQVREFFQRLLDEGIRVEVVPGNHDAGLSRMVPEGVVIHPMSGLLRGTVGYFHGHAWPSREILERASVLVTGHLHPGFRLAPSEARSRTGKEPCWIRVRCPPAATPPKGARRIRHPPPRAREIVVLPAFNPLCAGEALNREAPHRGRRFLVRHFLSRGEARAYLLDGTDLGPLTWGLA